jgi:hypothetical protein
MQLEEIILMRTCRFVIFSALHKNKAAQFLRKHTGSIMRNVYHCPSSQLLLRPVFVIYHGRNLKTAIRMWLAVK